MLPSARVAGLIFLFLASGCAQIAGLEERKPREKAPTPSAYRQAVVDDNPIGYLRFGESGGTQVLDEAAGRVGNVSGSLVFGVPGALAGDSDTAIEFDGQSSVIDLNDAYDLPGTEPFSIEFWVLLKSNLNSPRIVNKSTGTLGNPREGWDIWVDNSDDHKLFLTRYTGTTSDAVHTLIGTPVPTDQFVHVVFTGDATDMHVFINGKADGQDLLQNFSFQDISAPFIFGKSNAGSYFAGALDEFAIYGKVLPTDRILAHYQAGTLP